MEEDRMPAWRLQNQATAWLCGGFGGAGGHRFDPVARQPRRRAQRRTPPPAPANIIIIDRPMSLRVAPSAQPRDSS
jgi:hypothetical protein